MNSTIRLGVFGGASEGFSEEALNLSARVGREVVAQGATLVTGGTHGIPHAAGKAAVEAGGRVLGISPAKDPKEHVEVFGKPLDGVTEMFWTGLGYTGRNFLNLRNCDCSIFIGGGAGTLEEFCVAVYEAQVIGVLTNSGGISEMLPEIVQKFQNHHGSQFVFGENPEELVREVLRMTQEKA